MSHFGSLLDDLEDSFFGMRQMRHMNNMMHSMNSLFPDPFRMMANMGGPLSIMGSPHGGNFMSLMPQMPAMPNMNRLLSGNLSDMGGGSSYQSSTVFMSSGPGGRPQIIRSTNTTKVGPNGVKETKSTLEDSRTGTKKMSIGHHIGERAHVIEKEQNVVSGDTEETQEYINIEEDEAEDFDREFQQRAGGYVARNRDRHLTIEDVTTRDRPLAITDGSAESTLARPSASPPQMPPSQHRRKTPRSSPLATPQISRVREIYSPSQPSRRRPLPGHLRRQKSPPQ